MKLALEFRGVAYDVAPVDFAAMKSDREHYPFAQCPRCAAGFAASSFMGLLGLPILPFRLARSLP